MVIAETEEETIQQHEQTPLTKISIMSNGTRGDFQPFLAAAIELKAAGYHVQMLSNSTHQAFAEEFNIEFVNVYPCFNKRIKESKEMSDAMANGDLMKFFDALKLYTKQDAHDVCHAFIKEMKENKPDLLLEGTLSDYFGAYAKHVLSVPTMKLRLQTFLFNAERAPMGLPTLPNGGHFDIMKNIVSDMYDSWAVNDAVMESMGHPRLSDVYPKTVYMEDTGRALRGEGKGKKIICQSTLFKDIIAPHASDKIAFVGPCIIDAKQQTEHGNNFGGGIASKRIEAFLNDQPESKPVYCGWGSMICKSPQFMVEFVVKSIQISGERGIVLGGVANLSLELLKQSTSDNDLIAYAEKNILFVEKISHENVFPCVKCIIHHGGAGTTNAALRSGVPSIITPVFTDQFDHAHILNVLGIGIGFSTQLQQITPEELGETIMTVVESSEMRHRAKKIQTKVIQENGKKGVVVEIQNYWASIIS